MEKLILARNLCIVWHLEDVCDGNSPDHPQDDSEITDNAIIPLKERVVDEYYDPLGRLFKVFK
jgi:hypothetical protein